MTRAARRLQLAQPALSQAIARLESQVGAKLLERNPRGVTVTAAGEAFLERARATVTAFEDVQATARSLARAQAGRLMLGFLSLTPPMTAGDLFTRFTDAHPEADLEWRELGYPTINAAEWLGEADAALVWFAPSSPELASQPIRTSPFVVAVAEHHRLARHAELTVDQILDETFPGIVEWCDPGWLANWGLDRYRGGAPRRTAERSASLQEVASTIASGRAISTVPEMVAAPFAPFGIKAIPLVDADPAVLTLVWPHGTVSPLLSELIATSQEVAGELMVGPPS